MATTLDEANLSTLIPMTHAQETYTTKERHNNTMTHEQETCVRNQCQILMQEQWRQLCQNHSNPHTNLCPTSNSTKTHIV